MTDYKAVKIIRNGCEYYFSDKGGGIDLAPGMVDVLIVGGGGGGGCGGSGGGGGGVIYQSNKVIMGGICPVKVGAGGAVCAKGGDSQFGEQIAYGGGSGPTGGGSSGGGGYLVGYCICPYSVNHCSLQGNYGGDYGSTSNCSNWADPRPGGGGAGTKGGNACKNTANPPAGKGGDGVMFDITGQEIYYGAGGGGNVSNAWCHYNYAGGAGGKGGGGNGSGSRCGCFIPGCAGSGWGAGGGGAYAGHAGIVVVRYKTDGTSGISCAVGGEKYECGEYTIHCFTSSDNFIPNPPNKYLTYLVVGGGGGASHVSGGGGGEVVCGLLANPTGCYQITVGGAGTKSSSWASKACDGGDSSFGEISAAGGKGGHTISATCSIGGDSGSGKKGGITTCCLGGGGGGGSNGNGGGAKQYCYRGGDGGIGLYGYGGGGAGGACVCGGNAYDGGGGTNRCCGYNATNCGGGGGGGCDARGNGACGVVDICYKTDGSTGINCATGGTVTTSGDWTIHRFTTSGTFTIVS